MLTDTHCHLADATLRENLPHILTAARKVGVKRFIVPATCPQDWQDVADLAEMPSEHGQIRIALGIHPWFSDGIAEQDFAGGFVIIHNLKATADIAAAVKQTGFAQGGIVHAFSGSAEEARVLTKLGFKIGIGSLLLNPNARKVRDTLKALNDGDFVLETDSPFMLKKEINTPANIPGIAKIAAEIRGTCVEEIAKVTERNADALLER